MNADEYVREVESALRDLPWKQRRELIADLPAHLAGIPAGTDFTARLGSPEQYAADLRTNAGLERRRGPLAWLRARRPRNVILVVATVVVVALVGKGVTWVQRYQPLTYGGGGFLSPKGVRSSNGLTDTLTFHKHGHFELAIPVQNNGSFAVRVLGLGGLSSLPGALIPTPPLPFSVRLEMSPPYTYEPKHFVFLPFRPFDLQPGQTTMLRLDATYARSCRPWGPGRVDSIAPTGFMLYGGDIPIRFHFLWKTSTALVFSPFAALQIRFPKGCL